MIKNLIKFNCFVTVFLGVMIFNPLLTKAEFGFAPPKQPDTQVNEKLDLNTKVQLGVISSVENKFKSIFMPYIGKAVDASEGIRKNFSQTLQSKLKLNDQDQSWRALYSALYYVCSRAYVFYAICMAFVFLIIRIIFLRLNIVS